RGLARHEQSSLPGGGEAGATGEAAPAELAIVVQRDDPDGTRPRLGIHGWRDGGDGSGERLVRVRGDLEADRLPLAHLTQLGLLDVNDELETGRNQGHDRGIRTDEGSLRDLAL